MISLDSIHAIKAHTVLTLSEFYTYTYAALKQIKHLIPGLFKVQYCFFDYKEPFKLPKGVEGLKVYLLNKEAPTALYTNFEFLPIDNNVVSLLKDNQLTPIKLINYTTEFSCIIKYMSVSEPFTMNAEYNYFIDNEFVHINLIDAPILMVIANWQFNEYNQILIPEFIELQRYLLDYAFCEYYERELLLNMPNADKLYSLYMQKKVESFNILYQQAMMGQATSDIINATSIFKLVS